MHDPAVIDSAGDGVLQWGAAFKRFHGTRAAEAARSGEVFGVCGAACLVTKDAFDELGGFDEHFFVSHEDVDLSYRARLLGYRCRYAADAVVRHHGSATLGRTSAFAVFHGQRNLEWLYLKNSPLSILLRSMPGHLLYTVAAAGYFARLGLLGAFLRAQAGGRGGRAARAASACRRAAHTAGRRRRDLAAARAALAGDEAGAKSGSTSDWPGRCRKRRRPERRCAAVNATPEVTAIVVNFNAGDELRAALASVARELDGRAWDGVVVDNASQDGSAAIALEFAPAVTLIANPANVGFGRAVNQALAQRPRAVRADHEPRLPAAAGSHGRARSRAAREPQCAIAGPRILNPDGSVQGSARGDPDMLTGFFGRSTALRRRLPWLPASRRNVVDAERARGRAEPGGGLAVGRVRARAARGARARRRFRRALFPLLGGRRPVPPPADARLRGSLRAGGDGRAPRRATRAARREAPSVRAFHDSAYLYYATHVAPGALNPKRLLARALLTLRCWWLLRATREHA